MAYQDWLKIVGNYNEINSIKNCPNCGKSAIKFQFVGDEKTRIGHLYLWCDACMHGIHISRVNIPIGVKIVSFDIENEELLKIIPKYHLIT